MATAESSSCDYVLVLVGNIPHTHHSSDLRNYFSQFTESRGFKCFHFRHRPERKHPRTVKDEATSTSNNLSNASETSNKSKRTLCCVVKVCKDRIDEFFAMYNGKHWINEQGEAMPSLCFLAKIRITDSTTSDSVSNSGNQTKYFTREEQKQMKKSRPTEEITKQDLDSLIELNPPDIMPNGNVGTPTKVFLDMIQACKLPPVIIKKLGLTFPKMRSNKFYGSVPFEYDSSPKLSEPPEKQTVTTASGHFLTPGDQDHDESEKSSELQTDQLNGAKENVGAVDVKAPLPTPSSTKPGKRKRKRPKVDLSLDDGIKQVEEHISESDSDDCEDWERHEALHDDAANAERNKQRVYEEELEVVWEKGGSGLVFYTDAQLWKEQEGDFDEQTADDWDVDMEIYTDPTAGDKDARDMMEMRQEQRRRKGIIDLEMDPNHIGKFEKHTKGFGRKLMEKQGWRDGEGLGSWTRGMSQALHNEGQAPGDRTGIGYTGEKLQRFGLKKKPRRDTPGLISTIYDNKEEIDPQEPLLRRQGTHHLKHSNHSPDLEGGT